MQKVQNSLRVVHFPQVGSLRNAFIVYVKDEEEAHLIVTVLALQHLWLEKNNVIPDYSNVITVEMLVDNEDGGKEWNDYWNEEEMMEWDELAETYLEKDSSKMVSELKPS